jgi:tetratricopeptide (TPR) repeat protein
LHTIETCEAGGDMPPPEPTDSPDESEGPAALALTGSLNEETDRLFHEVRRLLALKKYDQVIDRLDVHRPAEWAVLNRLGARTLRILGQAYAGRGDLTAARECLEQLRDVQRQQPLLAKADYAAVLSDLYRCYRGLGLEELAKACQEQMRELL